MSASAVDAQHAAGDEDRFEFGANWSRFLSVLTEERIRLAESSLRVSLGGARLDGLRFLDIGCGSGLFSLAARRLGSSVTSFDYDPAAVACAEHLKRLHFPDDRSWRIGRGSVLDASFLPALGQFDVVYAWGVLHHTGDMWAALANACDVVDQRGRLFIALYNDQGAKSRWWRRIKRTYNRLPRPLKPIYMAGFGAAFELGALGVALGRMEPGRYLARLTNYQDVRGMSRWHDIVDWIGGYPFEVATPDSVFEFCRNRGFTLVHLKTCGGKLGCNEFVFQRD